MKSKQNGFTFVEIMIVVAIIGILASVALPAYNNYISKARATDATSTLADMRIRMEQYFQDNRTYATAATTSLCAAPSGANTTYFGFSCTPAPTATGYTLKATGTGVMTGWNYYVNEANVKTSDTPGGSGIACWSTSKGGNC